MHKIVFRTTSRAAQGGRPGGGPYPIAGRTVIATRTLTGAQAFVACLEQEGVAFVFGVPGGQTLSITDGLLDAPSIRFVATRHECAAAHMADAYGRLTGRPGVALATTGPGATNLLTGVGGALRDSSPALIVTCNNRRRHIGQDDNQDADHVAIFRPLVKHGRFVPDPEAVPHATREAFRIALSGNPGPVHLDFARDALETGAVAFDPLPPAAYRSEGRPLAREADLARALDLLLAAERPLIWAGKGALLAEAGEPILALAHALDAPVVTTFNGIGAVPGDDPLVFGPYSRSGTSLARGLIEDADTVLCVGNSLNAVSTGRWRLKLPRCLIQIDLDPALIGRHYPVAASAVGDARDALERLHAALAASDVASRRAARAAWRAEAEARREAWRRKVFRDSDATSVPVRPQWLMHEVARALADETIVVADAGNPGIWSHLLPIRRPRSYMKPVGFGNMGFGLPAAIAAKLARPEAPVLVLVGDGSLGMALAEIETAVREDAPMAIVVLNDMAYGNIKQEQLHLFGQRTIGVDFTDVRYADVARAMGADGERVREPEEVGPALARALASPVPYLVDVLIDGRENVWEDPI